MSHGSKQPSAFTLGVGVAMVALWPPSCGGKSVYHEGDPDDPGDSGGSDFGGSSAGGEAGTAPVGARGGTFPQGGNGNAPNGGDGIGAAPIGGNGALGGTGVAGVGLAGRGFGGVGGVAGGRFGGFGAAGGVSGFGGVGGIAGGRGRGMGMGGRFGMGGFGGRFGGRGPGGSGMGGGGSNPLDGFTFLTPCRSIQSNPSICALVASCPMSATLPGDHPTDVVVTMPGSPGVFYDMTIHFQGLVESNNYTGGVDQDGYSNITPADGFYTGGAPTTLPWSVYLVRVNSPARDYFLNSIAPPSMSSIPPPFVVDYRAIIRFEGGTTVRLVSADGDCNFQRNCGSPMTPNTCEPVTVPNLAPTITDDIFVQPYPGQFIGMVVEAIATVQ